MPGEINHALEPEPELFQQPHGVLILRRSEGGDAGQPQGPRCVLEHRLGRLQGVAVAAAGGHKGEANLYLGMGVTPQQPADADRAHGLPQFHEIESESELPITCHRTRQNVLLSVLQGSDGAIADVALNSIAQVAKIQPAPGTQEPPLAGENSGSR